MSELLSDKEVGKLLKSSPRTVRNLSARGAFPSPLKIGRLTRWRRSDVERHIEQAEAVALSIPKDTSAAVEC